MAKAIGLIGNFKGKVGNMVGYQIPDSNTGNTQGIRIYQPVVKNPKTSAQAEQRAKLAPINATYRALKSIIDRGNEGLPYGNKSRLAWLKLAFHALYMPWYVKGAFCEFPVGCQLTKGSLQSLGVSVTADSLSISASGVTAETSVATVGALSTALMAANSFLKAGDQLTFVIADNVDNYNDFKVFSIVLNTTSTEALTGFTATANQISYEAADVIGAYAVIVSREGESGQHLRSTELLNIPGTIAAAAPYDAGSKTAAIESYMASAAGSTDWAEESIQ